MIFQAELLIVRLKYSGDYRSLVEPSWHLISAGASKMKIKLNKPRKEIHRASIRCNRQSGTTILNRPAGSYVFGNPLNTSGPPMGSANVKAIRIELFDFLAFR